MAGRPAELAGVENMVGLFINTLPLRMKLAPDQPLSELMRQIQSSGSDLMAHGTLGLSEIQQIAGVGELFDTLMVFENYPVDRQALAAEARGIRLGRVSGHDATHYPLSLMVRPGDELQLRLDYRPDLFDASSIAVLSERLIRLLSAAAAAPQRPIGSLSILAACRALEHPVGVEPDRASGCGHDAAGAVCRAGAPHPGRHRGDLRGSRAALRRARGARQPAGAPSARQGRRARDRGRPAARALARDGDRPARHPQGRRSLPAARSVLPGRAARLHAGRRQGRRPGHPGRPATSGCAARRRAAQARSARCRTPASHRPPWSGSTPTGPRSHASPPSRRRRRCTPSTPPTSSTHQDQPEHQKASS